MAQGFQGIRGHSDWVFSIAFSNADRPYLATGSDDGDVLVWELQDDRDRGFSSKFRQMNWHFLEVTKHIQRAGRSRVFALQFVNDSNMLIASLDGGYVLIWDLITSTLLRVTTLKGPADWYISSMRIDPAFPEYVITEEGLVTVNDLLLPSDIDVTHTNWWAYRMSYPNPNERAEGNFWISRGSEKVIRLPTKFYPLRLCVHGHSVVIGCETGCILFFKFQQAGLRLVPASCQTRSCDCIMKT